MDIEPCFVRVVPLPPAVARCALRVPPRRIAVATVVWVAASQGILQHLHLRRNCRLQPLPWHQAQTDCSNHVDEDVPLEGFQCLHQPLPSPQPFRRLGAHWFDRIAVVEIDLVAKL